MIDWDAHVLGPLQGVFGEAVTYTPYGQPSFQISGIFDEAYRDIDLAGGMGITTEMPVLGVQLSQFPIQPMQGDSLTILRTAETFVVKEVRQDGHGSAKLMLNLSV